MIGQNSIIIFPHFRVSLHQIKRQNVKVEVMKR